MSFEACPACNTEDAGHGLQLVQLVAISQRSKLFGTKRQGFQCFNVPQVACPLLKSALCCCVQANIPPATPPEEWPLDALAAKMRQYCYLLEDLTGEKLKAEAGGDYEALRAYLRQRGIEAYNVKVAEVEEVEPGLMQVR